MLKGNAPDPVGYISKPLKDNPNLFTIEKMDENELARQKREWHREGRRAELASFIYRKSLKFNHPKELLQEIKWSFEERRDNFLHSPASELKKRRQLVFTSHYIHPVDCQEVEGYFDFNKTHYPVTLIAASRLPAWAKEEWERGDYMLASQSILSDPNTILIPGRKLDAQKVKEALERFYEDKFRFERGHWTHLEDATPEIIINLNFSDKTDKEMLEADLDASEDLPQDDRDI